MTPALARERARMGALRARTLGACLCQRPLSRGMGALGDVSADFGSALTAKVSAQTDAVKAQLASAAGVNASNSATVSTGGAAAVSLAQNGFNPQSADDEAKLVQVIAGGLALVPGVGPLLAGAVEALWVVGNQIACPVTNAFAAIGLGGGSPSCGARPCTTSGTWTTASVLSGNAVPAMPRGSFAALAVPALAYYAAQAANCKGGFPGSVVVDGVVALWNRTHAGPPVPYLIPPIGSLAASPINPAPIAVSPVFMLPSVSGANDWQTFGFGPVNLAVEDHHYEANPPSPMGPGPWPAYWTPPAPPGLVWEPARIVMVNAGGLIVPHTFTLHLGPAKPVITPHTLTLHLGPAAPVGARAPVATTSTGGKVAGAAAAAGAAALLWWLASNRWKWRTPRWAGKLVR